MAELNLALRFLLEVAGLVAVGYWGFQAESAVARWVLGIGGPIALFAAWALLVAPGATNPIPQDVRILLGSAVLLLAAGLLYVTGQQFPAVIFAAIVAINTVLMFVLRESAG